MLTTFGNWNAIGSTGWDLLYDMINGEDFIKRTLNRHKNRNKDTK